MKTTLDLPDELAREVKLRAVMLGKTVKELVAELLSQALGLSPAKPPELDPGSLVTRGKDGLPLVRCRDDAAANHMTAEDLLKLERKAEAQEDLKHVRLAD